MLLRFPVLIDFSRSSTAIELAKAQDHIGWIPLNLSLRLGLLWCAIVPIILIAKFQSPFDIWSLHQIGYNFKNCFYFNYACFQAKNDFFFSSKNCEQSQINKSINYWTLRADTSRFTFLYFPSSPKFLRAQKCFPNQSKQISNWDVFATWKVYLKISHSHPSRKNTYHELLHDNKFYLKLSSLKCFLLIITIVTNI